MGGAGHCRAREIGRSVMRTTFVGSDSEITSVCDSCSR